MTPDQRFCLTTGIISGWVGGCLFMAFVWWFS